MTEKLKWSVTGVLLMAVFVICQTKPPSEIHQLLAAIAGQSQTLSLVMHLAMLSALALGFWLPRRRTLIWAGLMALLAASTATMGAIYVILPNIVVFCLYLVLILTALWTGGLEWDLTKLRAMDWLFGLAGLTFGFWYLHWVDGPIWLNALLYSPLGVLNCPTIATISGLLCLSSKRPAILEFTTGLVGVYFGFFGIMRLGAYVDVILVLCGLYQLMRLGGALWQQQAQGRGLASPGPAA